MMTLCHVNLLWYSTTIDHGALDALVLRHFAIVTSFLTMSIIIDMIVRLPRSMIVKVGELLCIPCDMTALGKWYKNVIGLIFLYFLSTFS